MSLTDDPDLTVPDEPTLPGRRYRVQLEDGESFTVRVTNREFIRWDLTAPKKKWGSAQDVPFLAGSFLAWAAARREGKTALSFEQFQQVTEDVAAVEEDAEDIARPTRTGPARG